MGKKTENGGGEQQNGGEQEASGTKARVLTPVFINGRQYEPNDVGTFDDQVLTSFAGELDTDPAAVAYAESLKAE